MNARKRTFIAVAAVAVCVATGGAALANGLGTAADDAPDQPITGTALEAASAAALAATGGGTVTGTEVGDEVSYYEVEVTLDNGDQVDVHLNKQFTVVGQDADGEHQSGDNAD